jgi:hypothetical protein
LEKPVGKRQFLISPPPSPPPGWQPREEGFCCFNNYDVFLKIKKNCLMLCVFTIDPPCPHPLPILEQGEQAVLIESSESTPSVQLEYVDHTNKS